LRTIDVTTQTGGGLRAGEMTSGAGTAARTPAETIIGRPRSPAGFDGRLRPVTTSTDAVTRTPVTQEPKAFDKTLKPAERAEDC
jgi:hypothetical protein